MGHIWAASATAAGWFLLVAGIVIAPLPGPMGAPLMAAGGLVLVRRSRRFRRMVAGVRGRFPTASGKLDHASRKWPRALRYLVVKTHPSRVR